MQALHGPQPFSQSERRERIQAIASQLITHYGEDLLALGLYGSASRGTDGPYSDIELHCILAGEQIDHCFEWSEGPWKAEVDVYSPEIFMAQAAEMDEFWPITHGSFANVSAWIDRPGIFARAKAAVYNHTDDEVNQLLSAVLIGDVYELIGKARNAITLGRPFSLAGEAVAAARYSACALGLAHRHLYSTGPAAFSESLSLPDRPEGHDALTALVLAGDLRDNHAVSAALDDLWEGMENWAIKHGLVLHQTLEKLLTKRDSR